jgi:hypothetical protein
MDSPHYHTASLTKGTPGLTAACGHPEQTALK